MKRSKRTGDWIAVLEAGYSLDGDDGAWLAGVLESVAREHWPDRISAAFTFELGATAVVVGDIRIHGPPQIYDRVRASMDGASTEGLDRAFRSGRVVNTISELIFGQIPADEAMFKAVNADVGPDILGIIVHSGDGRGVLINLVLDAPRASTHAERRLWTRCAAHIGAGLRLRTLAPEITTLDSAPNLGPAEACGTPQTSPATPKRGKMNLTGPGSALSCHNRTERGVAVCENSRTPLRPKNEARLAHGCAAIPAANTTVSCTAIPPNLTLERRPTAEGYCARRVSP